MKNNKNGISLISLIITIVVLIIIATVTIQKGLQRTDDAKIAKHNTNISTTQEEVESYYYYKSGELPLINLTPFPIQQGSSLENEITKNGEKDDDFYVLDFLKLGKVAGNEGTGAGNDIYIVSSKKHNVYYVRGTIIKGLIYHGLINDSSTGFLSYYASPIPTITSLLTGTPTPTITSALTVTPTITPTSTITPTPTPVSGSGFYDGTVNSPKLSTGMIAVKWNGSSWVEADPYNIGNDWYDYRNTGGTANKWANAQLADGSLLVWIPRYTYQIASGEHTSTAGAINIRFSNGTTDDTSGGYRIHPAFYWGGWNIPISAPMTKEAEGTELTGIWVGKFESSAVNGLQSTSGDKIRIKDNVSSWRGVNVGDAFTNSRAMQTTNSTLYGISSDSTVIDTHLLKNSGWGAVAYLSKYALGPVEVALNSNPSCITGNGNIVTNKAQSTTGNENGIYDMRGCSNEYVAAYLNNGHANLIKYGNSLVSAAGKYKDVFPKGVTDTRANNYAASSHAYGYAMYETSSVASGTGWFFDVMYYPYYDYAFFLREGYANDGESGLFATSCDDGNPTMKEGSRIEIVVP